MADEKLIIVSLQKSGTHLTTEMARALGYSVSGWIFNPGPVKIEPAETKRLTKLLFNPLQRFLMTVLGPNFRSRLSGAMWGRLTAYWGRRLGVPIRGRHGEDYDTDASKLTERLASHGFADGWPKDVAFIIHEMPLAGCEGLLLRDFFYKKDPKIIFNYRDPRDILVSFVNYLSKPKGFSQFSEYLTYHRILTELPDLASRVMYAIQDPNFPGSRDLENHLWLFSHPDVCKISYEEMVGNRGGGSDQARDQALQRVISYLGKTAKPEEIASKLYDESAATFHKGQIGGWKEIFTDEHHRAFNKRYGDLTRLYGYELVEP